MLVSRPLRPTHVHKRAPRRAMPIMAAIQPMCDNNADSTRILPSYFEAYTETVCKYEQDKMSCLENMDIPNVKRQEEILEMYSALLNTYPIEHAASLRYTMWKIIASGDPEPLARAIDLLNQYVMSLAMIEDMIQNVAVP